MINGDFMEIKAINLDFYGTLVDWLPIWIKVSDIIVTENNLDISSNDFALEWRGIQRDMLFKKAENIFNSFFSK